MPRIDWEVSGRILLQNQLPLSRGGDPLELADRVSLANATVEVSASRLGTGGWNKWGHATTDTSGRFRLAFVRKSDKPRRFRLRVWLSNDELAVVKLKRSGSLGVAPIVALKDDDTGFRSGPSVTLPTVTIDAGSTRTSRQHARRASLWYAVEQVQRRLRSYDDWIGFMSPLAVVYPTPITTWASGNSAQIGPKYFKASTVIHESMHVWDYQHNKGMSNWVCAWVTGGTHSRREAPSIAFHEGFASWASRQLLHEIWGHDQWKPYTKEWLSREKGIATLEDLERSDNGVMSVLRLLTDDDPYGLLLGTTQVAPPGSDGTYADRMSEEDRDRLLYRKGPILTTKQVLAAFEANAGAGWPTNLEVGKNKYGLLRFLDRLSDIYPLRFGTRKKNSFLGIIDPAGSAEMSSFRRFN